MTQVAYRYLFEGTVQYKDRTEPASGNIVVNRKIELHDGAAVDVHETFRMHAAEEDFNLKFAKLELIEVIQ